MNKFTPNKVYQGLKPIKSVLPKEIRKLSKSQKNLFDELKEKWSIVVGAEIASQCSPEKIKSATNQEKKTLFLNVPKHHILDIDYSRDYIIEKLNSYFGYHFVSKIVINSFKVSKIKNHTINNAPSWNENLANKIELIKNEKLKNTFKNFFKNEN
jgi:hypothetical protein